jgi:hypothetical protein
MKTASRKKKTLRTKARTKKTTETAADALQGNWPIEFPEVKGKTIEAVKLYLYVDDCSLSLLFTDKTHLYLDLEAGLTVRAAHSDWKTGNGRPIKCWPPFHRDSFWFEEPCPQER